MRHSYHYPVSESQKPRARMSSLASSSLLAERGRISPFKGCSRGSTATSLDTSRKTPASVSRRSLCLSVWKPPSLQIRTWSTSNALPHRQDWGARRRGHPYRSATASWKALLWRTKPCLSRGITESQRRLHALDWLWHIAAVDLGVYGWCCPLPPFP